MRSIGSQTLSGAPSVEVRPSANAFAYRVFGTFLPAADVPPRLDMPPRDSHAKGCDADSDAGELCHPPVPTAAAAPVMIQ